MSPYLPSYGYTNLRYCWVYLLFELSLKKTILPYVMLSVALGGIPFALIAVYALFGWIVWIHIEKRGLLDSCEKEDWLDCQRKLEVIVDYSSENAASKFSSHSLFIYYVMYGCENPFFQVEKFSYNDIFYKFFFQFSIRKLSHLFK